ncbi:LOW QUALITY PROTEIN: uncharacterized protein V5649_020231 [Rhynchonycteris naso]
MDGGEVVSAGAGLGQGGSTLATLTKNPQATLTVVVEVEWGRESGYNVALLLQGRETEALRLVPQLLQEAQILAVEEALPLGSSDPVLSTLSLVQLNHSGRTWDLLSPGAENLSVLGVAPLGLVVKGASEAEVSDSRAASELYLRATAGEGRLAVVTPSMLSQATYISALASLPAFIERKNQTQVKAYVPLRAFLISCSIQQWTSFFLLPSGRDCPLLQVLAGKAVGKKVEGSLPWIVLWLLEGNNYSGLLLRLGPQGGFEESVRKEWFTLSLLLLDSSLNLLQAALLGAIRRRMQIKVKPTLWDVAEEARACQAGLKNLRSHLLQDPLSDDGLSKLGRELRELQVIKAWSRRPGICMFKGVKAEAVVLPEAQVCLVIQPLRSPTNVCLLLCIQSTVRGPFLYSLIAQQAPDVALQFFLAQAQAQRQRLREHHQVWIQEELKHLEQKEMEEEEEEEEEIGDQVKDLVAGEEAFKKIQRRDQAQAVLRLQLEALQAEQDTVEQDLIGLYDLHVQATRAQAHHILQVFAWRGQWEEQTMITEHRHCSLLAGILQDTINLAGQNQELQAQNQQLQLQNRRDAVMLDPCPGEKARKFQKPHDREQLWLQGAFKGNSAAGTVGRKQPFLLVYKLAQD